MEKDAESLATVTIKPDYPPSEVYSSEPPPAYHRHTSSAVQVARIIAYTVVAVAVLLGSFILAAAYVQANASCKQLEQELEFLSEAADRFPIPPQPEALVRDAPTANKRQADSLAAESTQKTAKEINNNNIDNTDDNDNNDNDEPSESNSDYSSSSDSEEERETPIHFKLPLQLDFDDLAGALIEKNQKSNMNCIVEKKRAEEVVDHQPKTVRLPFGVNLTTDPRYERLSGERMVIFCESGNVQRQAPPQEDEEEETIMIQPVMIPIPASHFPTHMPQQMHPMPPQQEYQPTYQPQQYQNHHPQAPMHPMEAMRPPMPPMVRPAVQHMIQIQTQQQAQPESQQEQSHLPPTQILHHIAQQIITQKIMEAQKRREEEQRAREEQQQQDAQPDVQRIQHIAMPEGMVAQRIPIPEEVLTQLNRLPNRDVIVAVQEQDPEEDSQEIRMVPQSGPAADRQTYGRGLPVDIPVPMMQQVQVQPEQQEQAEPQEQVAMEAEEQRPHYVQPRSVRSVDALLPKDNKRVKRCSCDCAC